MLSSKWTEYCEIDTGAKKTFLKIGNSSGSQATMNAFDGPHSLPLRALIDKDIVNIIIGNMMFHPEDMDKITRARLLGSFVLTLYSSADAVDAGNVSRYATIVSNTKQFQLVAQYLTTGL